MMRKIAVKLALASTALSTPALANLWHDSGDTAAVESVQTVPVETFAYQHGGWPPAPPPPPSGGGGGGGSPTPTPSPTKPSKPG